MGHSFIGWNPAVDATVPAHDVTYTAQFTINQYTITFDTDGGSEIAPITQDYNTAISAPANPTKTGYTFAGWDKEIPATMPAENITIKALWTINKYKLTYKVDGEVYKQYEIEYNSAITPETAPTKEGYTFSGWSEIPAVMPAYDVEVNGSFTVNKYLLTYMVDGVVYHTDSVAYGTEIVLIDEPVREGKTFSGWKGAPETMPARDVIIMGSFDANVYTLTYKVDGEIYKSVQYPYGAEIIPEAEPTKEGYTFSGWSEIPSTMPAHDVEVNGSFTVNKYKVTFISDGTVIKEDTLAFGSPITAPANPTKVGHSFIGWNPAVDATVPAHDVTYTAQFTINQCTITFDTDGGSEIAPITQDYNTAISAPANPTKTGYTFAGWDREIPATMPAENITIKALWTINKYLLTYKVDGEVYKQYEIEYNSAITPETAPTKEGYTFSGWGEIPAVMPAHDVEVNGSFTVNKYLLTYMVDGVVYHTDSVAYGTEIVLIDEPVREGKTFSGWKGAPETMPARDVIIMGSFDANVYTLTYKVDGEIYKSVQYPYGAEIIPEAEPTKEGYTFSGWSEIPATMPAHDVEVTGTFAVNYYLLTYFVDGEVYMTDSIAYGMEIVPEAEPTKEGYTFSGWSEIPTTMPAHDVEVTGSFSANTYYIIYKVEGEEYFVDSVKYGEQIVPVEEPEREGLTFSGWQGLPEDLLMPAHDVEVTGTFVVNYYQLTYLVDGEVYQQDSVAYGTEIVLLPNPEKPGYIFSGWSGYPEDLMMPAADVTIVGSFEVDGIQRVAAGAGTEDTMYDVLGRKVQNPRKGEIYLQNGKKIMIRW